MSMNDPMWSKMWYLNRDKVAQDRHIVSFLYRVRQSWVDLDIECSTICLILHGLVGIWPKRLAGSWPRWWSTQIKVNPTKVHEQMGHPVADFSVASVSKTTILTTESVVNIVFFEMLGNSVKGDYKFM